MMIADMFVDNGRYHYHKGFYIKDEKNVQKYLKTVKNPRKDHAVIDPYFDAQIFLFGSCDLFALALNREYGFKAYAFVSKNQTTIIHCFCVSTYLGMPAYVDVRGVTTDFEELISPFSELRGFEFQLVPFDLTETEKLEEENAEIGFEFAQNIIKKYHSYYEQSNCVQRRAM
ncbi:MAG: hypothetical protein IJY37_02110 [Clostridia bacterium]|nr:hypothetical protein [Clostridia bacterium]MBQ8419136.1 hypothetical protein [Clostridia bacterium]